jgi:hypothetical protein
MSYPTEAEVNRIPTSGNHFGLKIDDLWIGQVFCHNVVRVHASGIDSKVYTVVPRDSEWLEANAKDFFTWLYQEPFFTGFFDETDVEKTIATRVIVSRADVPIDYWYVCAQFMRTFFQGAYTLEVWNKVLKAEPTIDPFLLLSVLMITRPEPDELAIRADRGIIDGHMPFLYTMNLIDDTYNLRSSLFRVKHRMRPQSAIDRPLWSASAMSYRASEFFYRELGFGETIGYDSPLITKTPYNFSKSTSESGQYPEMPWSVLVDRALSLNAGRNPSVYFYLNLDALKEMSK